MKKSNPFDELIEKMKKDYELEPDTPDSYPTTPLDLSPVSTPSPGPTQ